MDTTIIPVAPAVAVLPPSAIERTVEEAEAFLQSPTGQALLAEAEKRAAAAINALPSAGKLTPGVKTSEFWCLVVFFLLSLCTMLAGVLPPKWAVIAQAVSVGLYQISRGLAKRGTTAN